MARCVGQLAPPVGEYRHLRELFESLWQLTVRRRWVMLLDVRG